ncbi:protein phosphatase 1F isoform X2 [Monodelphis domestica]|nr:protein phosphatase 1F isoform X2 [Monodelphis domestica]XP_056677318.1 protein phosphatase 1F isoform X2 [Monodelphis domestica]XP_056677319.1 protein phosphatase 1F isoform X2 [Monodelphis domestica]
MTSAAPKDAQAAAQDFLDSFLGEFPGPPSPEAPLPWKAPGAPVSQEEAEGELIELALSLLCGRNAPLPLACSLTREAVTRLMQEADLSAFRQAPREERGVQEEEGEEDDGISVALLDAKSLQRCFFRGLWEVCSQWQKQMPAPSTCASRPWMTSIHAIRNTRRKMEDRHVSLPAFNELFGLCDQVDRAYFAVFDGHGGVDAANYAAIHVHVNIARHLEVTRNPAEALRAGFKKTDEMFLQKARREKLQSGTTGVCVLLVGRTVHVAWLGDSQVMLVQQGQALELMKPHKPERPDERERIEALGGFVSYMDCWRVNGTLAVSRAIGDVFQKPYVSGEADVASHELSGTEDYLLLACDGFFDSVSREEVAGLVHGLLLGSEGSGLRLAEELVAAARQRGSRDNITVLVVFLRDPRELLRDGPPGAAGAQQDPSVAGSASACFGS